MKNQPEDNFEDSFEQLTDSSHGDTFDESKSKPLAKALKPPSSLPKTDPAHPQAKNPLQPSKPAPETTADP